VLADSFRWFHLWLILHILAVVAAFGPTFAFGVIAALGRKKPEHIAFAAEAMDTIQRRMVIPAAAVVPILGTLLIYTGHFDLWKSEWLLIAIGLYIVLFGFAVFVQNPNSARMVQLLATPGGGTSPEAAALGKKLQMGGSILGTLVLIILVLMVWRPGSCQGVC
jgi:hypothetical protein